MSMEINDSSITGCVSMLNVSANIANLSITGNTSINNETSSAIEIQSKAEITIGDNVTIKGEQYGISLYVAPSSVSSKNDSKITLGNNDGMVNNSGPKIIGKTAGIKVDYYANNTLNFYDRSNSRWNKSNCCNKK